MKFSLAILLLSASGVYAADPVPLDVKVGQWEATVTSQISGLPQARQMPQIPPEQLAKLPPEQRAKIEAMMSGGPQTSTSKTCVKQQDLAKLPVNNDQSCKTTLVSSSGTKQEIHMECNRNGSKQSGTITIEALSSELIKFRIESAGDAGGNNMSLKVSGTSKWIGPACDASK